MPALSRPARSFTPWINRAKLENISGRNTTAFVRILLTAVGVLQFVVGLFFAGQGSGLIMWPASSFMFANAAWVTNGLGIAPGGAAIILISRRIGR